MECHNCDDDGDHVDCEGDNECENSIDDDRRLLDEEIEYDEKEIEHEQAYNDFGKRVSCFAHIINLSRNY